MSEPGLHRLSEIPGCKEAIAKHGKASEKTVVDEIVAMLERRGFRKPTKGNDDVSGYYVLAGQRSVKQSGSDSGVPDILVLTAYWCLPLEVKRREVNTEIKASQWRMWQAMALHIVNSAEQVSELIDRMNAAV